MPWNTFPESMTVVSPVLKSPLADRLAFPQSQQGRMCGFFETQFYRCMEAYGAKLGRRYCDLELRDYKECMNRKKQQMRADKIRAQRMRLLLEGKLDRAFVENHPKYGEYQPDYFGNCRNF